MNLAEMLGVDLSDPEQRLAQELVEADEQMLDELIALRKRMHLTQADVAERMGISQGAVARIESGERDPHLSTLRRYAHAVRAIVRHEVRPLSARERYMQSDRALDRLMAVTWRDDPRPLLQKAWAASAHA